MYIKSNTELKKQALTNHLSKVEARKKDYLIKRGNNNKITQLPNPSNAKIKSVGRDFERFAKSTLSKNDDIGMQTSIATYDVAKYTIKAYSKLNAVSNKIADGSVKVVNGSINIAGKTYKIATNMYAGYKTGTLKGTINMYKNMTFSKAYDTIKYSKPVFHTRNIIDSTKGIYLSSAYRLSNTVSFVKGVKNGTVKITPKQVKNYIYTKGANITKKGVSNAISGAVGTVKGAYKFSKSPVIRGSIKGLGEGVRSISKNSDDIGVQAVGTSYNTVKYSAKITKETGKGIIKAEKTVAKAGNGAYKTAKGTYKFYKDVKKSGIKNTSKIWYNAHMKGAGKKVSEKISNYTLKILKKALFNPVVLGIVALLLCVIIVGNTAVLGATSTVGGIIEFFEELADGLREAVETVKEAISDFLENCVDWVCSLFGGKKKNNEGIEIDIDIGDSMSICDYLLGTVQVYKAKFGLEVEERRKELIKNDGYHDVLFYNYAGDKIVISDIYNPDKGLMKDKDYVKIELPVWKAIIFGTIGTGFTGRQANNIAQDCFETITKKIEIPYCDINGDGIGDYNYCDGSNSLEEGENLVVTHIGGVVQHNIHNETGLCYNNSGVLYHDTHNTDGIACCITRYWCGGHSKYLCNGHISYCTDINTCTNKSSYITYCVDINTCTNKLYVSNTKCTDINTCTNKVYDGTKKYCTSSELSNCANKTTTTTYCWTGKSNSKGSCTNYSESGIFIKKYTCNGHVSESCSGHDNYKCGGHNNYKCGGHTNYNCNGHTNYCWTGWSTNYGSCTNYTTGSYQCYIGIKYNSQGCTNEKSEFTCKGYNLCLGHKLMKFYLGNEGFDSLVKAKFLDRINELKSKSTLSDSEKQELSQLEMHYEYALGCEANSDPIADEWYAAH